MMSPYFAKLRILGNPGPTYVNPETIECLYKDKNEVVHVTVTGSTEPVRVDGTLEKVMADIDVAMRNRQERWSCSF